MVFPNRDFLPLCESIRNLRKQHGWSQEEFAAIIGGDPRHYQDIEAGKVDFGIEILLKIYRAVAVDWNTLMGEFGSTQPVSQKLGEIHHAH